jgi:nicotinamidase-related amidase
MEASWPAVGEGTSCDVEVVVLDGVEDPDPGICETQVVLGITRLVEELRKRSLPIIYLCRGSDYQGMRDVPERLRNWIRQVERASGVDDIFWSGNPAYAVRKEFAPQAGDTIIKNRTFGAFNSSVIESTLQAMVVDTLVITGISTDCCVETTARDAADRGFACAIVEECVVDYDEGAHDAALRGFHFNLGRVLATADETIKAIDQRLTI